MAFLETVKLYGQIADISLGASLFYYHVERAGEYCNPLLCPNGFIDITYGKKDFSLREVKVQVVSDNEINSVHTPGRKIIKGRCNLKFKELSRAQSFLLNRLLLTCTKRKFSYLHNAPSSLPAYNEGFNYDQEDNPAG